MKKYIWIAGVIGLFAFLLSEMWTVKPLGKDAQAQIFTDGSMAMYLQGHGTETLSIGTATTTSFDSSIYSTTSGKKTHRAHITLESANIRYWYHGQDPTSSIGHKVGTDTGGLTVPSFDIVGIQNIINARFIAVDDGSNPTATAYVTYEKLMPAGR